MNPAATPGAVSASGLAALGNTFASATNLNSTANGQLTARAANGVTFSPGDATLPGILGAAALGADTGATGATVSIGLGTMPGAAGSLLTGVSNLAGYGSVIGNSGVRTPAVPVAPTTPVTDFVGANASMVIGTNQAIGLGVVSGTGVAQSYVPGQTAGVGTTPVFVQGTSEFDGLGTVGAF